MVAVKTTKRDSRWHDRLQVAQMELDREKAKWRRNRALLLGLPPQGIKDWTAVNLGWAAFETMVGACYNQISDTVIRETNGTTANVAKVLTTTIRDDFEHMRLRYYGRLAIMDVFWAGFGFVMEKMSGDPTLVTHRFDEYAEDGQPTGKYDELKVPALQNQRYDFFRVHPATTLRDPMGSMPDMSDWGWLSIECYPTVKELRENFGVSKDLLAKLPKLRQNPNKDTKADYPRPDALPGEDEEDEEYLQVRCREIWDRVKKRRLYIPCGTDTVIEDVEWPVQLRYNGKLRFPGAMLYFNENPESSFPIAEIEMAAPQLEQFTLLFRSIVKDSLTKWRKYVYRADMFDQAMVDKIKSEPGVSLIPIRANAVGDPTKLDISKSVIVPLVDPQVKQDQLAVLNLTKALVHEIFGAGDFASNGFRNTRSATEAAQLSQFLRGRVTTRTENIDSWHREISINHALFLQETMSGQRVAEVIGEEGAAVWVTYTRDQIQGDFRFNVIAGSSMPQNTESHRQESIAFFQQIFGPVVQQGGTVEPLIRWSGPLFHMPEHVIDQVFNGHRQALIAVAQMLGNAHMGKAPPTPQFLEAVSAAVRSGLSIADQQMVAQQIASQPVSPPGTNTSDQTLAA